LYVTHTHIFTSDREYLCVCVIVHRRSTRYDCRRNGKMRVNIYYIMCVIPIYELYDYKIMCYIYERARRGLRRNTTTAAAAAAAVFCLRLFIYYIMCYIMYVAGARNHISGYTLGTSICAPRVMAKYGAVSPFSVHPCIIWFGIRF